MDTKRNYRIADKATGAYHYFGQFSCVACRSTCRVAKPADCMCTVESADDYFWRTYAAAVNLEPEYIPGV